MNFGGPTDIIWDAVNSRHFSPALSARHVVAKINERMPRTHGNTLIHVDRLCAFIHSDQPLHTHVEAAQRLADCILSSRRSMPCLDLHFAIRC